MNNIIQQVYEHAVANDWKWRFDNGLRRPSYEDVETFLTRIIDQVRKSTTSISVESGGILVKRTEDYIDVYVHAGGLK